jgi:hypothetical protein
VDLSTSGNVAWAAGIADVGGKSKAGAAVTAPTFESSVFEKRGDRWLLVSHSAGRVPQQLTRDADSIARPRSVATRRGLPRAACAAGQSRRSSGGRSIPVFPDKQTKLKPLGTSHSCQEETFAQIAQISGSSLSRTRPSESDAAS